MQLYTRILIGMAVGVVCGLLVGPRAALMPRDAVHLLPGTVVYGAPSADGSAVPETADVTDAALVAVHPGTPAWAEITWTGPGGDGGGFVPLVEPAVTPYSSAGQALVDGTEWIGRLFLALIRMVVVPLVFASLALGVASLGNVRTLGRIGARTLGLFLFTVVVAATIGIVLTNVVEPGRLMDDGERARLLAAYAPAAEDAAAGAVTAPSIVDQLVGMVPTNPVAALAEGDMLQIIVFAVLFGVALTLVPAARAQPVLAVLDGVNEAIVVLVHLVMWLAPFGVAALLFKVVGTTGVSVLVALSAYAVVVLAGLFVQLFVVYHAVVRLGAGIPFFRFLSAMRPAIFVAFGTSSSSATLPVTMRVVEENLGVSRQITSFVLPLGATVNMDGTALYQAVATVFIAQIYGMDLSLAEQGTIVLMATLASVGAAGVPGAGMITLTMVLTAVGVPVEGLALVLGVDRLLDMFRTTVNVLGDCVASVFVARLEGESLRVI